MTCLSLANNSKLRSASAGPASGMNCARRYEPEDPDSGHDNYLCTSFAHPFQWSYGGPISGKNCLLLDEPSDGAYWQDNCPCAAQ